MEIDSEQVTDRMGLYESARDFFLKNGSAVMKLTPSAAVDVCVQSTERHFVVGRVEGGIWRFPGFEARLDCIWDGRDPPLTDMDLKQNNELAAKFIESESGKHDVFIVTVLK